MQEITDTVRGFPFTLQVRPGVFSKNGVDVGSRLLLNNLKIEDGTMIADLGCGSGIIGFVAAKLNPKGHVHLFDVNLRNVELARENAVLNELPNVEVFISDLFSAVGDKTYEQILSNPPMHIGNEFLTEAAEQCKLHLKKEGRVTWVVQKHIKPYIQRLFTEKFGNCSVVTHGDKHIVMQAIKE